MLAEALLSCCCSRGGSRLGAGIQVLPQAAVQLLAELARVELVGYPRGEPAPHVKVVHYLQTAALVAQGHCPQSKGVERAHQPIATLRTSDSYMPKFEVQANCRRLGTCRYTEHHLHAPIWSNPGCMHETAPE